MRSRSLFGLSAYIAIASFLSIQILSRTVSAKLEEKFTVDWPNQGERWEKYSNDEGKIYFWSETFKRSQWEDPRDALKVHEAREDIFGNAKEQEESERLQRQRQQQQTEEQRKFKEDEERRRITRIAYEEEQQRRSERDLVSRELDAHDGERIVREERERREREERKKLEEKKQEMNVERMRQEKTEAKERAEAMEKERLQRMEYVKKEKERKEELRKDTERKEKERIENERKKKGDDERQRLMRAAKLVEEETKKEEDLKRTKTTNEDSDTPKPFSYSATTTTTTSKNVEEDDDSTNKKKMKVARDDNSNNNNSKTKRDEHEAPNPLPDPEHHDDVNSDHALNIDDHEGAPKRHAPFVDGVVAQFFIFLVTTLTIWIKTMFRKFKEWQLAKELEKESDENENDIFHYGVEEPYGGGSGSPYGSPTRNRNGSRTSLLSMTSPVASVANDLEDQRVKYGGSAKKNSYYFSRRLSQSRIMMIDVSNAYGIFRKSRIIGMYFERLMKSTEIFFLARLFISFYYFNAAAEKYAYYVWRFKYYEFHKEHGFPRGQVDFPIGVPYGALLVVVITTLMVHDIKPSMCCVYLLFWDARESLYLFQEVFLGPKLVFNELAMKRLSVLGSTLLLLVNTIQSRRSLAAAAAVDGRDGLLFSKFGNPRTQRESFSSKLKSITLALARLALASAFLYVGWEQVSRIAKKDYAYYQEMYANGNGSATKKTAVGQDALKATDYQKDGHDSNWLLIQFILAMPLFLGLRTKFVCRLMALSLFLEACLSWDFWNAKTFMPEHARTHFVVNLSCAGGMLLLQMFGAGAYSFDSWLLPKKIV